ncbi:hypothetical protein [Sphingorhabdus sp. SMR4y]|uniref:hypothetical protein n=1 Tax=Sphingorhabdus sp. SMR4y TaxID=2584094 RepID=UPI000B5CAB82|nr:hypothetical protein [Sphingorhabdus sp. SMR4y]ASK86931.1 hypothetical protein SPHFLASMR4Y_00138 [Sphingorhabdus sp. SMR4y]
MICQITGSGLHPAELLDGLVDGLAPVYLRAPVGKRAFAACRPDIPCCITGKVGGAIRKADSLLCCGKSGQPMAVLFEPDANIYIVSRNMAHACFLARAEGVQS